MHQTAWQKRLLRLYGNDICLLDATYKTTRYALPLFFLAVKTNVDYQVVGSFVTEDETVCSIKEALEVVREWNPDWSPHLFMTDNCSQEIQAIENLFPECKVLLCDFHREQAWERWASKTVLWHIKRYCSPCCEEQHMLPRGRNSSPLSQCWKISTFGKATKPYVTGSKTRGWQSESDGFGLFGKTVFK